MGASDRDYMREVSGSEGWPLKNIPAVAWLIAACVGWYLYQVTVTPPDRPLVTPGDLGWSLPDSHGLRAHEWWRLVSYGFVHGDLLHLLMNGIMLFMMGRIITFDLGGRHVWTIFLLGTVTGGLAYVIFFPHASVIGASAGAWALTVVVAMLRPDDRAYLPMLPQFPLRFRSLILGFLLVDAINAIIQVLTRGNTESVRFTENNIASMAHLGGALGGWLYAHFWLNNFSRLEAESDRRRVAWQKQQEREDARALASVRGRARREQGQHSEAPEAPAQPAKPTLEEEIDALLDKAIELGGIENLSESERAMLDRASQDMARRKRHPKDAGGSRQ